MSKRNRREHGRILSVETMARGDSLADDFAAGATSITVNDAGDFDEDGGWLYVGAQTVEYTECDDDTGIITLADPLAAAAEQGDPVRLWSDLYGEVVEYQQALVELDGEYDNPDPVAAEVAEGVGELPEGDRGKAGESCTLHRVSDDEWEVVAVGGRSRKSQGSRWEQDDYYVLTADDVAAGVAVAPLSHRPNDEALTCVLAGAPQRPTSWTIDYNAQTLTVPLSGWEKAGDVLWVHYAYRKGIATTTISDVATQRFYLPATLPAADASPSFAPEWEYVGDGGGVAGGVAATSVKMTLTRGSSTDRGSIKTWFPGGGPLDVLSMQYVSHEQVASARTISGTFSAHVWNYGSSAGGIAGYMQIVIRVVSADGSAVRGYLYQGCAETSPVGNSDATSIGEQNQQLPGQYTGGAARDWTNIPLDPVAAQAGDRVVVEIGPRRTGSNATGQVWTMMPAEQPSSPGGSNDSWFEFNTNAGLA